MAKKEKKETFRKNASETLGLSGLDGSDTFRFIVGLILLFLSIYLLLSFSSYFFTGAYDQHIIENPGLNNGGSAHNYAGVMGARVSHYFIHSCFGISSFFFPLFFILLAMKLMHAYHVRLWKWFLNFSFLMIWLSITLSLCTPTIVRNKLWFSPGGMHGDYISDELSRVFGPLGLFILLVTTMLFYLIYLTRETKQVIRKLLNPKDTIKGHIRAHSCQVPTENEGTEIMKENGANVPFEIDETSTQDDSESKTIPGEISHADTKEETILKVPDFLIDKGVEEQAATRKTMGEEDAYDPTRDLENYHFPPLKLLKKYDANIPSIDEDEQNANKDRISGVLHNFGVEISSIRATVGPTITLYEITPAPGIRISKIKNLEDDIALSLSALGIRIIAPIPGKGTIGIEVPNKHPLIVSMESILNSKKFQETNMTLPVALGKTITNEVFMVDLAKLPHLLVAGATGQGKSVGLNAIITSLLYKKHPSELKIVMIDPKKVEFSIYTPIEKHFLAKIIADDGEPIITDVTKVVKTLKSLCLEMDMRYDLLKKAYVRNIKEYNEKFKSRQLNPEKGHRFLPYIVVIIDEFGDLIMTAGKEIELPIARIAQLARAVGIHMVIATQRPTTNIITGTIKANFPARMAFKVASLVDSRTILDRTGANQLVGRGDMLFLSGNEPVRVQCAFVDTPEVERITEFISKQQGYLTAFELPDVSEGEGDGNENTSSVDMNNLDPLFHEAARLIVIHQQGSTSLIQRKFSIGYNRAGRIMDQLEKAGVVGIAQGSKPRDVLCADEIALENLIQTL